MKKPIEFKDFPTALTNDPRYQDSLWRFRCVMKEVTDGDTAWFLVDKGFRGYDFHPFRLDGYDAWELFRGTPEEKARGKIAKEFLMAEIPFNAPLIITTRESESLGRYIAAVYYLKDGEVVALKDVMEANGHTKTQILEELSV